MTHAGIGEKGRRKAIGITDGMVRISVGIEDVDDILAMIWIRRWRRFKKERQDFIASGRQENVEMLKN
jgi:hypothetical protein